MTAMEDKVEQSSKILIVFELTDCAVEASWN